MRYNNYHKHTTYSSIFTPDTHIQPIEYFKRAKELGHNTYFTTEHGFGGDIFEAVSLSQQEEFQGIKPIFALEGYIVPNPLEKDNSNYHIMLIARTDNARKKLNKINSRANREGYYYKPRIFLEDLLQLDKDDIYITSACVAGFLRDEIGFKEIFLPLYRHFDKSLLLETQSHNENIQKKHNQNILRIAKEYDLKIIHANDSHYIYPDEAKHRLEYLKGKGITYGEEDNFILDYPDYETVIKRYKKQGILNEKQTQQALENTLLFDDCETIKLDNTIKMPNIYPDLTPQERYNKLENIVYNNWKQEKKNIDESKYGEYENAIRFELDIIKETNEEIHTADYFLLNERIVDIAVNKYNGILTKSGRGCFTEDALVHTRETLKSIKDIKVGDEVITESGVFNKVINTMKYDIEEELVQIKHIYGTDKYNPSICTLDHKILINRDDNINWIQAKDIIKGDYVCVPKINKQNIKSNVVIDLNNYNDFGYDYDDDYIYEYSPYMNNEYEYSPSEMAKKIGIGKSAFEKFANGDKKALSRKKWAKDKFFEITPFKTQKEYVEYINYKRTKKIKRFISIDKEFNKFIGLMYGDGFTHNKGSHTIGLAIHKENNTENEKVFYEIAKRLNLEVYRHDNKTKKLSQLYINSNLITNFIKKELFISKKGEEKQFNTKWFNQTKGNLMGLVEGLRLSDGSYLEKRINFDNTSKSLINAYKLLCLMTNEGVNSLSVRPSYTTKEGYDCKESYKLRLNPNAINNQKPSERIKEDDNYWYLPIKEIVFLPKQKVTVYDIEVENEHSYLLNNMIVHNSGVSFYINKLLGFTGVDRLGLNVPMYPTRFLSKTRLLESRSLPDFDFNTANPEPFIKATKDLLGENGCYWMIAYGTMKESEAFRNTCRNMELDHKEYNEIAKNIDTYKDDKKWKDIIKHSEKFVGSIVSASPHPCFLEDELVMTDKGYKKIARINKGDFVLTHTNQYKKVISTMENMSEDVYEIKAMGIPSTKVTGNHPYYVREMTKKYNPKTQTDSRFFSNPIWKDVKDLSKNDYLGIAINQKNVIPRGKSLPYNVEEFWWIIGRYIGDGWYKNERKNNKQLGEYNTIICTGKHEIKQVTDVLDKLDGYFHYFVTEESTVFRINILCKELWDFVKQFGKGASNKRLTNTIFDLPTDLLKAFIKGYISADGYKQKDGLYTITTVSRELAYGISSCINKAYKRPTAITYHAKKDSFINKRKIIGKNQYIIKFREFPVKKEQAFYENGYIWTPFRKSTKLNIREKTYNIEVEDDHSYTINNAIVHNCANVLLDKDIEEEIGVVRIGDKLCAIITSKEADEWKYLKNDYLTVLVVEIINDVFKLIGKDIIPISELISKLDDKVWDLYKNGITCTLNQVDSDFATNLIKKYAPTCYEEISAFVAAIRPGFASLLDTFINRQKYSTGVEALDEILETTEHYMLYQESVMQYLVWLGIPEDITYEIVKKIAKKTLTEEEIEELHNKLLYQWIEKNGSEDGFLESWEVIENNSRYSFNASHSISVALDSLYGAYLKANYPLEYYKVVLDKYRNDLDRTTKLVSELPYFNIKLSPIRFRHSGANYTIDKPTNTIYKGVASIKHLNHEVAEQLYELRNNTYNNFYELMLDIKNKVNIRSNQLDILIKLDYFEEFGKAKKLLDYVLYFNSLYDTKVVSKNKFDDTTNDIIAKYSRQTEKQFRDLDNEKILLDIWNRIPNEDLSILEKIDAQKEYLGYVDYANPELDKRYVLVMNLDTRFSPRFNAYCLNNGKTEQIKVYKKPRGRRMNNITYYSDIPFKEGDILFCKKFNQKPQSRKTEDGWEQIPGTLEWWLISYSKINSSAIKT